MRGSLTITPPGAPPKRQARVAGQAAQGGLSPGRSPGACPAPGATHPGQVAGVRPPAPSTWRPPRHPRAPRLAASLAHRRPAALQPARASPLCRVSRSRRKVTSHMP